MQNKEYNSIKLIVQNALKNGVTIDEVEESKIKNKIKNNELEKDDKNFIDI